MVHNFTLRRFFRVAEQNVRSFMTQLSKHLQAFHYNNCHSNFSKRLLEHRWQNHGNPIHHKKRFTSQHNRKILHLWWNNKTGNVTLRSVCATIAAVEKQYYIFLVCVALGILHAMCMHHTVCGLSGSTIFLCIIS